MIPLMLFLLGVAAVYVGTIETAFSSLMKLSLRLMAERGRDDRLGYYLDDPIQLFVPARLLLGLIFSLATVLLAVVTGRSGISFTSLTTLLACVAVYILLCEHVLPSVIVRRNPDIVIGSWCGKKFRPEKVAARAGWGEVNAVKNKQLFEIKSADILQPGPAALTDGVAQMHRIVMRWSELHG